MQNKGYFCAEILFCAKPLNSVDLKSLNAGFRYMQKEGLNKSTSRQVKKLKKIGWPEEIIKRTIKHPDERNFVVKLEKISFNFDDKPVLRNIDLTIKEKEIFGIIGLAGSGKTTLLHILVGLLEPLNGKVILRLKETGTQINICEKKSLANSMIGFSTQIPSFYPDLSIEENIEYFASLYGFNMDRLEEVKEAVFNLVSLKEIKQLKARNLSKGLQKKLDIACALIHSPEILVLDEPTADLDPILCQELWSLIRRINNAGTTIILASHQLNNLDRVCNRIGILHKGEFVKILNMKLLAQEPYEISVTLPHPKHFFKRFEGNVTFRKEGIVVQSNKPLLTAEKMIKQLRKEKGETCLTDFKIKKPSLKKIFDEVIGI